MNNQQVSISRVFGATMLVAGCCIGAGMLGLPVLTAFGGFGPTIVLFALSWMFMAVTGLLLLEVNLWFKEEVSIISMTKRTLGPIGSFLGWILFAYLFYSLMIAYVAGATQIVDGISENFFQMTIPDWFSGLFFVVLFGLFIYIGTSLVDSFNRFFMFGLVITYCILVFLGAPYVDMELLTHAHWKAAVPALPAMIVSFGYHNLIPSLTTYLNHSRKHLRFVVIIGSLIPLLIYLVWEMIILGLVPLDGPNGFEGALDRGEIATRVLRNTVGSAWIVDVADFFALFAVVTSLLSVALSFNDFLADGLQIKKDRQGKLLLVILSLGPPFVLAMYYPNIFLEALSYAGAYGAVILFGILPALMVWVGRYRQKINAPHTLPGGKIPLIAVILISLFIVILKLREQLF